MVKRGRGGKKGSSFRKLNDRSIAPERDAPPIPKEELKALLKEVRSPQGNIQPRRRK